MIGIEERKASERMVKKKQNAEEIVINGNIGYFQEWADNGKSFNFWWDTDLDTRRDIHRNG